MGSHFEFTGRRRVLLNVALGAVMFRVLHLATHSLWVDEGVTWWNATRGGWRDTVFAEPNHPPLWWLVTRGWLTWFPGKEAALRMPAALAGVLAVLLAYFLARRLSDPQAVPSRGGFRGNDPATAVWVAALAAVNPFWLEYAQEARMYAALLAIALGLSLVYLRWLDRGGRGALLAYGALAAVGLYTHYFALWPIAGHAAHALLLWWRGRRTGHPVDPRPLLLAQGVAGLLFLPWFLHVLGSFHGIEPGVYEPFGRLAHALWRMGVGPALLVLDRPRVVAGPLAVFAQEPVLVVVTALAWALPIGFGVRALARDRGGRAFVATSVLVPLALVLAACLRWPLVHEKYLIFLAPFLLYLAVLGARSAPGLLRPLLLAALVGLHAVGLFAYAAGDSDLGARLQAGHPYGKEQWREAHALVAGQAQPGDVVLVHAPFTETVWTFYDDPGASPALPIPPPDLPCDRALTAEELLARVPALAEARRVFLVLSHEATAEPDHYRDAVLEALIRRGSELRMEGPFEFPKHWGLRVYRFVRP